VFRAVHEPLTHPGSPSYLVGAFFFRRGSSLDWRSSSPDAPGVPISSEACFSGLKSTSELERSAALTELRSFLRAALARSFAKQLGDGELDDLTQESLLRIHSRLDSFEQQCRFTTWATAIAVNCALSELRRRRHRHVSLDDAAIQGNAALIQEVELTSDATERQFARLRQGIAEALTERQREATLARLGGLPLMEIARRLGTTQGAVYKLLHDARLRLKRYLEAGELQTETSFSVGSP